MNKRFTIFNQNEATKPKQCATYFSSAAHKVEALSTFIYSNIYNSVKMKLSRYVVNKELDVKTQYVSHSLSCWNNFVSSFVDFSFFSLS
jgi:hypothetical protein